MNALCEGLVYEPACSESEPCSKLRVTMAVRVAGTPFGNAGSCVFLGAANTRLKRWRAHSTGRFTLTQFTLSRTYIATVALDMNLLGLAKFTTV